MNSAVSRQLPPPGRRAQDTTNELLVQLIAHQLRFERIVMTQLEDIQARVATLTAALSASDIKVDVLIAQNDALIGLTDSIATQLAALGESGQIPPAALSDLLTSIDTATTAALEIGTKADAETAKVQGTIAADSPVPAAPAPESPAAPV